MAWRHALEKIMSEFMSTKGSICFVPTMTCSHERIVRGEGCYQEEIEKVFLTQKEFKDHLISKGTSHMKYHFCDVMNSYRRIYHREYNGLANMCIFFQFRQSTNSLKKVNIGKSVYN